MTDRILPVAKEWQNRPLSKKYAIVFMDAIHYNVRQDNATVKKAVYIAIGIRLDGVKEVLGMWVGGNESAKYWLGVLNEVKNRGVEDILIVSVDGLTGFGDAIHAVFPHSEIQRCIVHQIRYSTKFISYKDIKPFMADLKLVYKASTESSALQELDSLEEKWGSKYPSSIASWRNNWPQISTYFKYPPEIRKIIYTIHGEFQQAAEEGHEIQDDIPHGRLPVQDAVPGDDGHHKEMGGPSMELGADTGAAVYIFRRTHQHG